MSLRFVAVVFLSVFFVYGCVARDVEVSTDSATPTIDDSWYTTSVDSKSNNKILKSPADDRQYRFLTLDNGLKVLLVSDPKTDKAAASLSVEVGSFDSPPQRPGLAHFLEHMLFLGTDRYPQAGEYQAFISEHGGVFNAYTSLEETNYFFDVEASHLGSALDRFARFFIAPLFNPEYVDRERHAVESEYRLKIKDDSRREWDILRELANPEHPFSTFAVGNLDTLADLPDQPVREDLLNFYRRYYSADIMTLVVLGIEPLETLEEMVIKRFSDVAAHRLELPKGDAPMFRDPLPLEVSIRPEKDIRRLSFNFPLPRVAEDWPYKSLEFLGHLIGDEGKGSLLASLKKRGLAEGLSAGLVYDSRHGALFNATITLTPQGYAAKDQISVQFFQWLSLVKQQGIERWRYRELAQLAEFRFRYAEATSPMGYVSQLSTDLHRVAPGDVLRSKALFKEFDKKRIDGYGKYLNPSNVLVEVIAPEVSTNRQSALYGAHYGVKQLDINELQGPLEGLAVALSLPPANPYLPKSQLIEGQVSDQPVEIDDNSELWYFRDGHFPAPTGEFEARVALPDMGDLESTVLMEYFLAVVEFQLSVEAYPALIAGMQFSLAPWDHGFKVRLGGYASRQEVLLEKILDVLHSPDWDDKNLQLVKQSMLRRWRNTLKEWPLRQVFDHIDPALRDRWLPAQKADLLESLTGEKLQAFHKRMLGQGQGRIYAGGKYSEAQARSMARGMVVALGLQGHRIDPQYRVNNLPRTEQLFVNWSYVDHGDSVAILYLQGDDDSLRERALLSLLETIVQAPFYNHLRTEKQLGYAVGSSLAHLNRVPGVLFYVQSPKLDSVALKREIDSFLRMFQQNVEALTQADLERYRAAVLAAINEQPRNMGELAGRHLEALDLGYRDFDFRQQLDQALRDLSLVDVKSAFGRTMVGERSGLWLLSTPEAKEEKPIHWHPGQLEKAFSYPQ